MKKNIIITGGQLYNKGAQAMTFITVDEIAKRFPQCDVVLVSDKDVKRDKEELKNYKFRIIAEPNFRMKEYVLSIFSISRKHEVNKGTNEKLIEFISILKDSAALIDISGYALGADWGDFVAIQYCLKILYANDFDVPVYLMPQSFGPFSFSGIYGKLAKRYLQKALKYPKYVMGREKQGVDLLTTIFGLNNVIKTDDLVLQNRGIDLHNIYQVIPQTKEYIVKPNSIAIIPNQQNNKHGNKTEIENLYREVINYCINNDRNIYLIFHSNEDKTLCDNLKSMYQEDNRVINIQEEMSCVEFDCIVRQFDYIIASRFHSVVHAYRNGIPSIIFGWAIKYYELAKSVCQESYVIDARKSIGSNGIIETVKRMDKQYTMESLVIKREIATIQNKNVYDLIKI